MPGRSAILTYHSIDDSGSVISTPPSLFRRQIEFLAGSGIPVVPLDQAAHRSGAVAITFDDGFGNLAEQAIPLLEQYRLAATIFVVSRFCGQLNNWPSQPAGRVPLLPLLGWHELRAMPAGVEVGSHTATHPYMSRLPAGECELELRTSRDEIEQWIGRPVRWLAYPYGASSPEVRRLAGRFFDLAAGTRLGWLPPHPDGLDLPRIDTYYLRESFPLERLFTPSGKAYIAIRRLLREARRQMSG